MQKCPNFIRNFWFKFFCQIFAKLLAKKRRVGEGVWRVWNLVCKAVWKKLKIAFLSEEPFMEQISFTICIIKQIFGEVFISHIQLVLNIFIISCLFIGPESDHWECLSLTHSLTDWLTDSCLVNLIDVTLACEDDNSKLVEVVTVAHVDNENVLTTVWCRFGRWFGHKVKFLFRLWAQGFKVWSRFWSSCSGKILKLMFGHYFATDMIWSSILVEIVKLGLVKIFKLTFCRNADIWLRLWS